MRVQALALLAVPTLGCGATGEPAVQTSPECPLKVLSIIQAPSQSSYSTSPTLPGAFLSRLSQTLPPSAGTYHAAVAFNARLSSFGFAPFSQPFRPWLDPLPGADLESALERAKALLLQDAEALEADRRSRTKYVLLLLSDGRPSPVCEAGCDNDGLPPPQGGCECCAGACGSPNGPNIPAEKFCDLPRAEWCQALSYGAEEDCELASEGYPAMKAPCLGYNDDHALAARIKELRAQAERAGVGALTLSAVHFYGSDSPQDAAIRLQLWASRGGGVVLDGTDATQRLAGALDLAPLCAPSGAPSK